MGFNSGFKGLIFRFRAKDEAVYASLLPWLRMGRAAPPPIYFYGVHGENFIFILFLDAGGKFLIVWTLLNSKPRCIIMCVTESHITVLVKTSQNNVSGLSHIFACPPPPPPPLPPDVCICSDIRKYCKFLTVEFQGRLNS